MIRRTNGIRNKATFGTIATLGAATLIAVAASGPAYADNGTDTSSLRAAVDADSILDHLSALQEAADSNGGTRAAGTPGHVASAEYIEQQLQAVGYATTRQYFDYQKVIVDVAAFEQTAPDAVAYSYFDDYYPMDYTAEADVTAPVTAVDVNLEGDRASTSGCEPGDFTGFPAGNIALIQRGSCDFAVKAANAAAAGASGVIIFNQGNDVPGDDRFGVVLGTLGAPGIPVPVVGTSFAIGAQFLGTSGLTVRIALQTHEETVNTFNVLADTSGRTDRTVLVGAHLDSVAEGPGINDNGSGSAAILETAIELAEFGISPTNRVRFAWWSGEEDGLIGSDYYVSQLSNKELKNHSVNLNFDMVASPNPVRFVYDGDGDAFGSSGPNGSSVVEDVFLEYFASQGLATAPTEFDGRSDYFAFIENGIPAGGLFSGAEGIKTEEEAALFGGTAGAPYDACYHQACDDMSNLDTGMLEELADAVAHSTLVFAMTTSAVGGTAKGSGGGSTHLSYKGGKLKN